MNDKVTQRNYQTLNPIVSNMSETIANRVTARRNEGQYGVDPMTVITIANCIVGVIKMFYGCYSNNTSRALTRMRNPGFIGRILIKREIRRHADKDMVDDIYYGITHSAQNIKVDDLDTVLGLNKYGFFKEED